ncbi:MAG TPA: hypothetical protein VKV28_03220 [Candidatus Binataceae bacterium]|nr:hypothetical protein [Candidatus Binataceae bacterium]
MMSEAGAQAAIRAYASAHHISAPALERWLAMGEADGLAILELAQVLKLRTGQLLSALDLLSDIALRQGTEVGTVMRQPELQKLIDAPGSRPERASAYLARLTELRYPRLHRMRERLSAALGELKLPSGVTVVLPRDLSSDELQIRLNPRTPAQFDHQLEALRAQAAQLKRVIAGLGGSDEF